MKLKIDIKKMEGRFSIKRIQNGLVNEGLQLNENYNQNGQDTISELMTTTSTTCLYDNPPPKRKRSLVQMTREALPRLENYRNSKRALKRPSLGELHGGDDGIKVRIFFSCRAKKVFDITKI